MWISISQSFLRSKSKGLCVIKKIVVSLQNTKISKKKHIWLLGTLFSLHYLLNINIRLNICWSAIVQLICNLDMTTFEDSIQMQCSLSYHLVYLRQQIDFNGFRKIQKLHVTELSLHKYILNHLTISDITDCSFDNEVRSHWSRPVWLWNALGSGIPWTPTMMVSVFSNQTSGVWVVKSLTQGIASIYNSHLQLVSWYSMDETFFQRLKQFYQKK